VVFKLIVTKSNFKKINYDVILVTKSITSPKNVTKFFYFGLSPLPIKISGYASDCTLIKSIFDLKFNQTYEPFTVIL